MMENAGEMINVPRELTSNIARRGKWTAEEERYTEKIICEDVERESPDS
jgi:hypothetical protein